MTQVNSDDAVVASFNYKPELKRRLGAFGSFAISFSLISVTMGVFSNYGYVLTQAGPVGIWTWLYVALGQLLVALIFAELSGRIPLSGYAYQWVGRFAGRSWGWFTGWIAICNWAIAVVAVDFVCAPIIVNLFDLGTSQTTQSIIVIALLTIQFFICGFRIHWAARLNNLAVFTEIAGIVGLSMLLFLALAKTDQWHFELLFTRAHDFTGSYWPHFLLATLLGSWSLVGFEGAADLAEETVEAQRNVPRAVIRSLLLSAAIGFVALVALTLAMPDLDAVTKSDTPILAILQFHWGRGVVAAFMVTVTISIIACGTVCITSASRLLFAMSRDGLFPCSGFFKQVSPSGVPWRAVGFFYVTGILFTLFSDKLTSLLAASSVLFALVYLIAVGAYAVKASSLPPTHNFSLRRGRYAIIALALLWLIVELGILTLPEDFHNGAFAAGGVCISGIALYWAVYRRKLMRL